jgi:hypothetical protein
VKALKTYGIPHHHIPLTADGTTIKVRNHWEYLKMLKTQEQCIKQGKLDTVMLPMPLDVLLGRGKPIVEYTGNLCLHALVEEYLPRFSNTKSRNEKSSLAVEIVRIIKSSPGRFLSKESGIWVEVDDMTAREKVNRQFRKQRQTVREHDSQEMSSKASAPGIRASPLDSPQSVSKRLKKL